MTRSVVRAGIAAISSTVLGLSVLLGQTPPTQEQRPVFRGGANFVNVDVYPRRDGRLVDGLTAGDFQVFEDGKPQKIELFEFIRLEANVPDASRRDPNSQQEAERLLDDPRRRVFVVYLDEYHISRETARFVRGPLVEFLERIIGPSDLFALMTPDVAVRDLIFGRRLEVVEAGLADFWRRMQFDGPDPNTLRPRTPYESFLYNCYIGRTDQPARNEALIRRLMDRHRMDLVLTSLEQLSARMASLRDERTNVLLFSPGWPLEMPADSGSMAWGTEGALPQVGVTRGGRITTSPTQPFSADRTKCDSEYLRLVSIDFRRRFETLVEDARRSNVSFTTIDPGGLEAPNSQAAAGRPDTPATIRMSRDRRDALRTLSTNTDGMAIVDTNDLHTPLRRLADNLASYYLLGYYSTNTNHDGRFRRIEVKVAKPDIKVTARAGYLAPTAALARAAESAPPPRTGSTPVENALGALGRVRASAELFTYGAAWPGRLAVVAELPAGPQAKWANGADVAVSVTSASGAAVGTARGRIEPPTRGTLLHVPLTEPSTGPWQVRVRVGSGADAVDDRLDIGLLPDGPIGPPILYRATPSPQSPMRPAADLQFFRTERLHVEWPSREMLDRREARVLGRNGQPLALTVPLVDRETNGQPVLVADLNLAPLASGDYVLELTVVRGARTEQSLVAFRVTR
ncbi:MAG TPA: VWA domain-containing protein [Vicinamibacterales bacterium]|nr:VWA domain-containing protein [Vicinamibacterales bacterium]